MVRRAAIVNSEKSKTGLRRTPRSRQPPSRGRTQPVGGFLETTQRKRLVLSKKAKAVLKRPRPKLQLSLVDIDHIADRIGCRGLGKKKKRRLLSDLNVALDQYKFEVGYETVSTGSTPKQLQRQFDDLHTCLRRLKTKLLSLLSNDRLFRAICRLGDAYAMKHGPHAGVKPRPLPRVKLPDLDEEDVEFLSSRVLRALIETVVQVERWMSDYDEAVVPKMAWKLLERKLGRTRSAHVRLIGKSLPAIYAKHFEPLGNSASSSDRAERHGKRIYRPWVHFISEVMTRTNIGTKSGRLTLSTIEQYWKRMRRDEPFEMVRPVGRGWTTRPKAQHFSPNWVDKPT
jgi:hypothetical protein